MKQSVDLGDLKKDKGLKLHVASHTHLCSGTESKCRSTMNGACDGSFRLLWGTAGASNALAVAEGLGFSPAVIKEARAVAANARMITDTKLRNETLVTSLDEQLIESKARYPYENPPRPEFCIHH